VGLFEPFEDSFSMPGKLEISIPFFLSPLIALTRRSNLSQTRALSVGFERLLMDYDKTSAFCPQVVGSH
jgi:hypothetical protein